MAFQQGHTFGRRFAPGQSGNPGGLSRARRAYADAFARGLMEKLGPDEAVGILAGACRDGQPWAVSIWFQIFGDSVMRALGQAEDDKSDAEADAAAREWIASQPAETLTKLREAARLLAEVGCTAKIAPINPESVMGEPAGLLAAPED